MEIITLFAIVASIVLFLLLVLFEIAQDPV